MRNLWILFFCLPILAAAAPEKELSGKELLAASGIGMEILSPFNAASRYREALEECRTRLRDLPEKSQSPDAVYCYRNMCYALAALGRGHEIPSLRECFLRRFGNSLPLLAAIPFQNMHSEGIWNRGRFVRREHPEKGYSWSCAERDRTLLLRCFLSPETRARYEKASPLMRMFFLRGLVRTLYLNRDGFLLNRLPDKTDPRFLPGPEKKSALTDGPIWNPVPFRTPASFDDARSDGERIAFAVEQMRVLAAQNRSNIYMKTCFEKTLELYEETFRRGLVSPRPGPSPELDFRKPEKTDVFDDLLSRLKKYASDPASEPSLRADLLRMECPDGGWGYASGDPEFPDPYVTYCVLEMFPDIPFARARAFLDGVWSRQWRRSWSCPTPWTFPFLDGVRNLAGSLPYEINWKPVLSLLRFDPETRTLLPDTLHPVRDAAALLLAIRRLPSPNPGTLLIPYLENALEDASGNIDVLTVLARRKRAPVPDVRIRLRRANRFPPKAGPSVRVEQTVFRDAGIIRFMLTAESDILNGSVFIPCAEELRLLSTKFVMLGDRAAFFRKTEHGFALFFRELPKGEYELTFRLSSVRGGSSLR